MNTMITTFLLAFFMVNLGCGHGEAKPKNNENNQPEKNTEPDPKKKQKPQKDPQNFSIDELTKIFEDVKATQTGDNADPALKVDIKAELAKLSEDKKQNYLLTQLASIKKLTFFSKRDKLLAALPLLKNLEDLQVDQSDIPALPASPTETELLDAIWQRVQLKKLEIHHSPFITSIPKGLGNLINLETLDLHDSGKVLNQPGITIDDAGIAVLNKLTKLKKLAFGAMALRSYDDVIKLQTLSKQNVEMTDPNPFSEELNILSTLVGKFVPEAEMPDLRPLYGNATPENYKKYIGEYKNLIATRNPKTFTLKIDNHYMVFRYSNELLNGAIYFPNLEGVTIQLNDTSAGTKKLSEEIQGTKEIIQQKFKRFKNLNRLTLKGPGFDATDPIGKAGFELKNGNNAAIAVDFDPNP